MAEVALVNSELETSSRIIEALDDSGLAPQVALWVTLPEYGSSRLILASRYFDEESSLKAYRKVLGALREKKVETNDDPALLVLRMKDPFIQELRKLFGKAKSVSGMRLGGQTFGDRFIEDGYVYRIS
jgi:hypothetical protein